MTAPWRAWRAVAVISSTSESKPRPGSWTASAASPWTCATVGITATRSPWSDSAVRAAISAARTESASLGSTTISAAPHAVMASSSKPADGTVAGTPVDDGGAGLFEQRAQPGAGGDGDDPAPAALGLARAGRLHLLGEVGDPDPVRAAGPDAGLDRGTDVVDVHVDVPQPVAADDHQRVAEAGQGRLERGHAVVGRVEEIHHLVRRPALDQLVRPVAADTGRRDVVGAERRGDRRRPAPGEHRLGGVQDDTETTAAGVDDTRVGQHLELFGRARQRLPGTTGRLGEHLPGPRAGQSRPARGRRRPRPWRR